MWRTASAANLIRQLWFYERMCEVAEVGWRDIGKASMAPTLEPEQLVYDLEHGVMYFSGTAGGVPLRCGIAVAVLVALEGKSPSGLEAMVATYLRNRQRVHEIIERKYRASQFEIGDSVVVRLEDLDG